MFPGTTEKSVEENTIYTKKKIKKKKKIVSPKEKRGGEAKG